MMSPPEGRIESSCYDVMCKAHDEAPRSSCYNAVCRAHEDAPRSALTTVLAALAVALVLPPLLLGGHRQRGGRVPGSSLPALVDEDAPTRLATAHTFLNRLRQEPFAVATDERCRSLRLEPSTSGTAGPGCR